MLWYLFALFVIIALVMIIIGLSRPSESAQAVIGFFFLFILSFVLINGNITYKVGSQTNSTILEYTSYINESITLSNSTSIINQADQYQSYNDSSTHNLGYWLAIASAIGMFGVFYSIKKHKGFNQ